MNTQLNVSHAQWSFRFKKRHGYLAASVLRVLFGMVLGVTVCQAIGQPLSQQGESIRCEALRPHPEISCTFTLGGLAAIQDISVKLQGQPTKHRFDPYPASSDRTALLMLVDISDAKRQKAVSAAVDLIGRVLSEKKPHQQIAVAQFDSNLQLKSDFNADVSKHQAALREIAPRGQATELYKSALDAIALLKKAQISRRALVIFSDGKAEDKGYSHDDVVREAANAQVRIFTVGYPESASETPALQTLERMAKATNGVHRVAATADKSVPRDTVAEILGFADHGGTVTFLRSEHFGQQSVTLEVKETDGTMLSLETTLTVLDARSLHQKILDHLRSYSVSYSAGGVVLISILIAFFWWRKRRRARVQKLLDFALLEELSGQGVIHHVQKQASRIGRAADNDVCLRNNSVSAYHAELNVRRDGSLVLIDLGSSNGIYLNGKKIGSETVGFGDLIELGEVRLRLQRPK